MSLILPDLAKPSRRTFELNRVALVKTTAMLVLFDGCLSLFSQHGHSFGIFWHPTQTRCPVLTAFTASIIVRSRLTLWVIDHPSTLSTVHVNSLLVTGPKR
ncbi:MAG TPA: hypothetical protein VN739_06250 [Nitrososphaerales archaeon]|nr:hypothetical protein [Nitrososphaerales archaeon]